MSDRVIVVGAGVVGLACAVRLLEAGHRVAVVARDLPLETTSVVAAALWKPYRAGPADRVADWAARSLAELERLAGDPRTGVRLLAGTTVLPAPQTPETSVAPVIDMPTHLRWLGDRVEELGGTITRLNLRALPEAGLVVNCSGIGARLLADDLSVTPVRGQVVVVGQPAIPIDRWWVEESGLTYVVPREHEIVLGGTAEEGEWSRSPDPATAEAIVARAAALVPALAGATVLRHKVGLRPARPEVRLERSGHVVHCYGHGGSGVTLAWGCADEVVSLTTRSD